MVALAVAAVAELSWPIVGCKNGRRKQRIAYRTFQRQNIKTIKVTTQPSIQSVQRSHNDFLRPIMKHDLAASDEVARRGSLHEFVCTNLFARICFHSSLYDTLGQSDRALSLLYSFRHPICLNALPEYLYGCLKVLISWSKLTKTITCLQCGGDLSRVLVE